MIKGSMAMAAAVALTSGMAMANTSEFNSTASNPAWLTPATWLPVGVPGAADVADFGGTGNPVFIGLNMNTPATHTISIGELTMTGVPLSGKYVLQNSTGAIDGTLIINGVGGMLIDNQSFGGSFVLQNGTTGTPIKLMNVSIPTGGGTMNVSFSNSNISISSNISGGAITKTGDGALILSGTNTFASAGQSVTVNGGSLFVNNPTTGSGVVSGAVSSDAGTTVGGTGTIAGLLTSSGTVAPGGVGVAGSFTLNGGLTLNAGASVGIDLAAATKDSVAVAGALTLPSTANTITISLNDLGSGVSNGDYTLMTYGSLAGSFSAFHLDTSAITAPGSFTLVPVGNSVVLHVTGAVGALTWNGNVNGNWDVNTTANWTGSSTKFNQGDQVTFSDAATGATTVTVVGTVTPGVIALANGNKDYTFTGSGSIGGATILNKTGTGKVTLGSANSYTGATNVSAGTLALTTGAAVGSSSGINLTGGTLQSAANITVDRPLSVNGTGATIDTPFNLTYTGQASGTGAITKTGTGTLIVAGTTGGAATGAIALNQGKISFAAQDSGTGLTGLGPVTINANTGTTVEFNNTSVGYGAGATASPGLSVTLGGGSTLQGLGTATASISNLLVVPNINVTLSAPAAADKLVLGSKLGNSTGLTTTGQITTVGSGVIQLASGGTSQSTSGNQYSGSWVVAMNPTGVLSLGPVIPGQFGEPLNALGYQAPTVSGTATFSGATVPVTVQSGTLAIGADAPSTKNSTVITATSLRSPVTLTGGNLASTGFEYTGAALPNSSTPVTANIGASINVASGTSKVLLYDPVLGTAGGSRSVNIMTDAGATGTISGNLAWGAATTLVVDSGGTTGGALNVTRDAAQGTVTVGAGAKLQITSGATVNLAGTMDALYDGAASAVTVANAGTFAVAAGTKHAAAITGTGTTNVTGSSKLVIVPGSATSQQNAVNIDAGARLDLTNNKLAINYTGSSVADGVRGQLASGLNGSGWTGTTGITSSTAAANANGATAIGYAEASAVVGAGGGPWNGVTVDGTTLLLKYTYFGDANLDGTVNGDDYALLDRGFNKHVANAHWTDGDYNYDGVVNSADYMLADTAFAHLTGVLSSDFLAAREAEFGPGYVSSLIAAVPEPTSLGLVGLVGASLIGRRRRSLK